MDATIAEPAIKAYLTEIRRLDDAARIAKAAEVCAQAGSPDEAVRIALDIVQLCYEARRTISGRRSRQSAMRSFRPNNGSKNRRPVVGSILTFRAASVALASRIGQSMQAKYSERVWRRALSTHTDTCDHSRRARHRSEMNRDALEYRRSLR